MHEPDNEDPVDGAVQGGILDRLRRFVGVVSKAFGFSSESVSSRGNHPFDTMASGGPIAISSSDSDSDDSDFREIDNYKDDSPLIDTAESRELTGCQHPSSPMKETSPNHSNLKGNNSGYQDPSSKKRRSVVPGESSSRPPKRLNNAESLGASSSSRIDGSVFQRTGSSITSHNFHQSMKRPLHAPLQYSSNPSVENVSARKIREDMYGKSTVWPNSSDGNNSMKEISMGNEHVSKGNRLLPPTLMPGRQTSPPTFVGSNDPFHHTGVGEESPAGADERYVFQAAVQDLHQPKGEINLPDGILSVPLLRHQKIALSWMLDKESSGLCLGGILADDQGLGKTVSTIALIQMQKIMEGKHKDSSFNNKTEALNLDDDGGNSDCVTLDDAYQIKGSDDFAILPRASTTVKGFHSRRPMAGTLIVCPASVIRQWSRELDEKVTSAAKLTVLIYHGGNRIKDPAALAKYDAVLTTYAIVANELPKQSLVEEDDDEHRDGDRSGLSSAFSTEKKRKKYSVANNKSKKGKKEIDLSEFDGASGTLAKVKWSRVVLDESQTIKNHRTQVARACCSLRAKRRWCLSGTPIQNSVDELYSYFRFLRYAPYDKFKIFGSSIKSLILRDSAQGYKKLQAVLMNIMLRRTKGTLLHGEPIVKLPPKKVDLTRVEFSVEERSFYEQLESDSSKQFKAYAAAGTLNQNYANILLMLLRLRQACDHPLLVKGLATDPVGKVSSQMAQTLPKELLVNLLKQLETSSAMCHACKDPPENPVVTMCGHVFCYQCVSDNLTGEDNTCPAPSCNEQLSADVVYSRATLRRCIYDGNDGDTNVPKELGDNLVVLQRNYISSKIKSALQILKSHCVGRRDLVRCDGASSSKTADPVGKVSFQMAQMLPRELLVNLLKELETSSAVCLVCKDPPENPVVTMCGHAFCYQCVSDNLMGEDNTCPAPACKEQLGDDVVFSRATLRRCIYDGMDGASSSKSRGGEVPEKAIVFSQWTSMLDLVEASLKKSGINYRRLDGTMSIAARDKGVKDFNTDPEVDVMLMSLKAGNLGLNMVAASRVILLDLWWNPTTEDQAVDRAHRIGQTRPVTVSRLTIKGTIEDRILALQEDKRKMVASAFGEDHSGGQRSRLTVDDLRFLFGGR